MSPGEVNRLAGNIEREERVQLRKIGQYTGGAGTDARDTAVPHRGGLLEE